MADPQTSFGIFAREAENFIRGFENDLSLRILKLHAGGLSEEVIRDMLLSEIDDRTEAFGRLFGNTERETDDLVNTSAQSTVNEETRDLGEIFIWTLDPTADHCDDCLDNSQQEAMTYDNWEEIGLPGMGATQCGAYCRCTLDPVE